MVFIGLEHHGIMERVVYLPAVARDNLRWNWIYQDQAFPFQGLASGKHT